MKNKLSKTHNIVNYVMNKEKFKVIYCITICVCIYGAFFVSGGSKVGVVDGMLICFSFCWFNIAIMLLMILNTLNILSIFNNEFDFFIIRLKNKKNVLKQTIKYTFLINAILFVMILLIFLSMLLIAKFGNLYIRNGKYNILNVLYLVFYLIRFFFILISITIINALLYYKIKSKIIIFDIIFMSGLFISSLYISDKKLFLYNIIPYNFFNNSVYKSFSTEFISSNIFMFIIFILILVIYKTVVNGGKKREIYFGK